MWILYAEIHKENKMKNVDKSTGVLAACFSTTEGTVSRLSESKGLYAQKAPLAWVQRVQWHPSIQIKKLIEPIDFFRKSKEIIFLTNFNPFWWLLQS